MHYCPSNIGNIPTLYFEMPKTFSNYSLEKKLQQIDAKFCKYMIIFKLSLLLYNSNTLNTSPSKEDYVIAELKLP